MFKTEETYSIPEDNAPEMVRALLQSALEYRKAHADNPGSVSADAIRRSAENLESWVTGILRGWEKRYRPTASKS